jgi:hypothetical protein
MQGIVLLFIGECTALYEITFMLSRITHKFTNNIGATLSFAFNVLGDTFSLHHLLVLL